MGAINLAATMDAIAEVCADSVVKRVYAWPTESITVPCIVVGYPEDIEFDMTFNRGSDRATFPVWYIAGKASDRTARDELSEVITGASGIKDALDGDLDGAVSSALVTDCRVQEMTVGAVNYIAARFDLQVYT